MKEIETLKRDAVAAGFCFMVSGWNDDVTIFKAVRIFVQGDFEKCRDWMDGFIEGRKG